MNLMIIKDYEILDQIGSGQYGKVFKGKNLKDNQFYAIKVINVSLNLFKYQNSNKNEKIKKDSKLELLLSNEMQVLKQIDNSNVIRFYEAIKTNSDIYFVYEYCNGGDLQQFMKKQGPLKEQDSIQIFKQVVLAFVSLTKNNIIHRDLKPANILFHDNKVKLADFGFCKFLQFKNDLSKSMVGSPIYMAPEILQGKQYDSKCDIWKIYNLGLGCVFYEMIYNVCPFEDKNLVDLLDSVKNKQIKYPENIYISEKSKKLLQCLLEKDPCKRIGWDQLFFLYCEKQENEKQNLLNIQQDTHQLNIIQDNNNINSFQLQTQDQISTNHNINIERSQENLAINLILYERNKILFIYKILEEIIEKKFQTVDLLVIIYVLSKYLVQVNHFYTNKILNNIKQNLVDNLKFDKFEKYKTYNQVFKLEEIKNLEKYKIFCNLIIEEQQQAFQIFSNSKQELQSLVQNQNKDNSKIETKYINNNEIMNELQTQHLQLNNLRLVMMNYIEEIKNIYFESFISTQREECEAKEWLIHLIKIQDLIILDETFDKQINISINELDKQQYFTLYNKQSKHELLKLLNNKMMYIRNINLD